MPNFIVKNRAFISRFRANKHIDRDISGWCRLIFSVFVSLAVPGLIFHRLSIFVIAFLESRLDLFERPSCRWQGFAIDKKVAFTSFLSSSEDSLNGHRKLLGDEAGVCSWLTPSVCRSGSPLPTSSTTRSANPFRFSLRRDSTVRFSHEFRLMAGTSSYFLIRTL